MIVKAKWQGRCNVCGRVIAAGSSIEWEAEAGARHVSDEACSLADSEVKPRVLRGPQPELPEDRERVERLLLAHPWKSATSKAYEKLPHQYSLRRQWENVADFEWVLEYIRRVGYEKFFLGRVWIYYDISEMQYWDCGGQLHECGLINRARRTGASNGSGMGRKPSVKRLLLDLTEDQV